jgi:acyl carrier protein
LASTVNIKDKLKSFMFDYFVKESGLAVNDDTSFLEKGVIDSTGVMELVAFLETAFGIKIEDEEIIPDNFDSINKMKNFVQQKLGVDAQSQ